MFSLNLGPRTVEKFLGKTWADSLSSLKLDNLVNQTLYYVLNVSRRLGTKLFEPTDLFQLVQSLGHALQELDFGVW